MNKSTLHCINAITLTLGLAALSAQDVAAAPLRYKQITAGARHTCALARTGELYCWGENVHGQLGVAPTQALMTKPPTQARCRIDFNGVIESAACRTTPIAVALCSKPAIPTTLFKQSSCNRFISVSAGGDHTCAIDSGSKIFCWGANDYGQSVSGSVSGSSVAVPPTQIRPSMRPGDAPVFTQVSVGPNHSCALSKADFVYCWGRDDSYESGVKGPGPNASATVPAGPVDTNQTYKMISAGYANTCGITDLGDLECWGANDQQQLQPLNIGTPNASATAISMTAHHASVLTTPVDLGVVGHLELCGHTIGGPVACWGGLNQGGASLSLAVASPTLAAVSPNSVQVAHSYDICGVLNGALVCGTNGSGFASLTPVGAAPTGLRGVALGTFHECVIDRSLRVECEGDNKYGQLGIRSTVQRQGFSAVALP